MGFEIKLFGYSFFEKVEKAEARAETLPGGTFANPENITTIFPTSSKSGTPVNEETSLTYAPFYAGVRVLSEALASMPFKPFYKNGKEKLEATQTDAYQLLAIRPNRLMSPFVFKDQMMATAILRGNAYAYIHRLGGKKTELQYLHPTDVDVMFSEDSRSLYYYIKSLDITVADTDMIHIRGFGNEYVGKSIIRYQMDTLGLGMSAQDVSNEFFANGSMMTGILTSTGNMTKEQRDAAKTAWQNTTTGTGKRGGTAVLGADMKYQHIGIAPAEAQWLETRKYSAVEVAAILKLPPFMIGAGELKFKDIAELNSWFYTNSLLPWILRFEQEFNAKIFTVSQKTTNLFYTKFNANSLLRMTPDKRAEYFSTMFNIGAFSINEIRDIEDVNPIENGDEHYVAANNMSPIGMQKEYINAKISALNKNSNTNQNAN